MLATILFIHTILLSAVVTAVASAAHGGNYLSKWKVVTLHTLLLPTVSPIFWLLFRRGRQAKAELDLLSGTGSYAAVETAYYFNPLGTIMSETMRYCADNPWPHLHVTGDGRRSQQELCGGFILGAVLSIPTALFVVVQSL